MKKLSFNAMKSVFLGSGIVAVVSACVIAVDFNTLFKANNDGKIGIVESKAIETQKSKVLVEAENEVSESKAKVEKANKEVEKATIAKENAKKEVAVAEKELTKAEETKKLAEAEVKNAKTEKERKAALEKVKAAEEAVAKAKATKEDANAKVQNAEKAITEAEDNKKAADKELQKAEENKKTLEEEIRKTQEVKEQTQTEPTKKESETKVESKTTTTETKKTTETKNNTVTNSETSESRSLTDEQLKKMLEAAAKGEQKDREEYEKAYEEKYGHLPPEEKHEVEFHFYSTLNPLTVRLYDHNNYYTKSRCGETGSGCIWFAEFSCDLNQCVGFLDSSTNELKGDVLYARRADIKEYTMEAPKARYGYKFKQWEIISDRKVTINGQTGIAYKYVAVYEKVK